MKYLFSILSFFVTTIAFSQNWNATFFSQDPPSISMDYENLVCVDILDNSNAYVGGTEGLLLYTADHGDTWTELFWDHENWQYEIRDVKFLNTEVGFFLYSSTENWTGQPLDNHLSFIYRTENGGQDWEIVYSGGVNTGLRSMCFLDDDTGYVVGSNGLGLKTIDGGTTWTEMDMGTHTILKSIIFLDEDNGWCVGSAPIMDDLETIPSEKREILHTTDGGMSWSSYELQNIPRFFLTDIVMFANGVGYVSETESAYGENSRIYKTEDNGTSWYELNIPDYNDGIYDLHFINELEGWAVGGAYCNPQTCLVGAYIIHTTDGGITWEVQKEEISSGNYAQIGRIWEMDIYENWIIAVGSQTNNEYNSFVGTNFVNPTNSIDENSRNTITHLYPNPAQDFVYFDDLTPDNRLFVYNALGEVMLDEKMLTIELMLKNFPQEFIQFLLMEGMSIN